MYDFVKASYDNNEDKDNWEKSRDEVYQRYQIGKANDYNYQDPFEAGINFAASIVSLLYGEGDIVATIKIAALAGWDSDNPAATWGGMLGFMLGKAGIEQAFGRKFSDKFNIHRTRGNFPNNGIDNFNEMARKGISIVDIVVQQEMGGHVDLDQNLWYIPNTGSKVTLGYQAN
jgi:hypothetical protein